MSGNLAKMADISTVDNRGIHRLADKSEINRVADNRKIHRDITNLFALSGKTI